MTASRNDIVVTLASAAVTALAVILVLHLVVRAFARRWPAAADLARSARLPFRLFVGLLASLAALGSLRAHGLDNDWWSLGRLGIRVLTIAVGAWLVTSVLLFLEDLGLQRYRVDVPDNRAARQKRTQVLIVRRLTVAVMVVLAIAGILLSFPSVKALGASMLASAGLIGVVAAIAAQSTLGNLLAGVQLAFNDAIRLDDAVIVEGEWGLVEEITLSYVVVRVWDDRRLVLPSTYFTSTPFQNWTRTSSELLGAVEFDLDWRVDTEGMRRELDRVLAQTELWDGRSQVLQVTDAVGGWVRVRVLVTAQDAPMLFDLRCHVREELVRWAREHDRQGLPRQRIEIVAPGPGTPPAPRSELRSEEPGRT